MAAIICLGMAVRDLVFAVPALPPVPRKLTATTLYKRGGGMAATAANAAAMLGGTVDYWGRLGDDETGRELRRELEAHGVRVEAPRVPGTQTPVAAVLVADSGERMLAVYRGQLDAATSAGPRARACFIRPHARTGFHASSTPIPATRLRCTRCCRSPITRFFRKRGWRS